MGVTAILLDFPLHLCAWRALRRSRENAAFWWWLLTWRWSSRPELLRAIALCAPQADVRMVRTPRALDRFLEGVAAT